MVGVLFQFILSLGVLLTRVNFFGHKLPRIGEVVNDVRTFDFTAQMYAISSALCGGIAILLIVLPAYGRFGTFMTAVLYVTVPVLANGVVDFFWRIPKKDKPIFGVFLLLSLVALFFMASEVIFSTSTISAFTNGLLSNIELLVAMVLAYGIFAMLADQTLNSGMTYVKEQSNPVYPDLTFSVLRIFWLAVLGAIIGIVQAIGHGGLTNFGTVLGEAVNNRGWDILLFVGIVQFVGVLENFAKALLLNTYRKTPTEVSVSFGVSGVVTFAFSWLLITSTTGFVKETTFDGSTFVQKIIAGIAILILVYLLAKFRRTKTVEE